ncbi:Jas TPL-binding domain [Sesbania bispinosa]|nr:Jas TPL-binding domain [Sesbania bispinosa]
MEGFFTEKLNTNGNNTELPTNCEQIDLTLKLSPCGQNAEERWVTMAEEKAKSTVANMAAEGEQSLMRFGDLQTMRRVRTGKRLVLQKQRRAAAKADKSKLKTVANPEGGASSANIQTSSKQENNSMVSHKAIMHKEMKQSSSNSSKLEKPAAKKLKRVNTMDILREMPCVSVTGDGPNGKRIEGVVYNYKYCGGSQVYVVCFCHGSFLSPAEFVMHAGGNQVANPMKHITLCSRSFCINDNAD